MAGISEKDWQEAEKDWQEVQALGEQLRVQLWEGEKEIGYHSAQKAFYKALLAEVAGAKRKALQQLLNERLDQFEQVVKEQRGDIEKCPSHFKDDLREFVRMGRVAAKSGTLEGIRLSDKHGLPFTKSALDAIQWCTPHDMTLRSVLNAATFDVLNVWERLAEYKGR